MNSNIIINQVLMLFLIIIIGYYAKKRKIIDDGTRKKLSELLLKVTSPLIIISSFQFKFTNEMMHNVFIVLMFSIAAHVLSALIGIILYAKYPDNLKKVMKFTTIYSNCGFMGFPVLDSVYGKVGILYGSIYVAFSNLFVWTNGVMIFSKKKTFDYKKALINPGVIAVFVGLMIFVFSIPLPLPIAKTIEMVGSMTTPISMLIIGATLADVDFRKLMQGFPLYYATVVRLIIIPVVTLIILKWLGLSDIITGTCVILVAMPAAAISTIFSEMYNGDALFASRVVSLTTLLSIATMPFIISLL